MRGQTDQPSPARCDVETTKQGHAQFIAYLIHHNQLSRRETDPHGRITIQVSSESLSTHGRQIE